MPETSASFPGWPNGAWVESIMTGPVKRRRLRGYRVVAANRGEVARFEIESGRTAEVALHLARQALKDFFTAS